MSCVRLGTKEQQNVVASLQGKSPLQGTDEGNSSHDNLNSYHPAMIFCQTSIQFVEEYFIDKLNARTTTR